MAGDSVGCGDNGPSGPTSQRIVRNMSSENDEASVYLNVYDMYWTNDYLKSIGLGVYHSGVEVHDIEYTFGGHPHPISGIYHIAPRDAADLGANFQYKETIYLGKTGLRSSQVQAIVQDLGAHYSGDSYHLLQRNCNHFSSQFAQILCGASIPPYVNRLATAGSRVPFIERFLPKDWLTPIALAEQIELNPNGEQQSNSPARDRLV